MRQAIAAAILTLAMSGAFLLALRLPAAPRTRPPGVAHEPPACVWACPSRPVAVEAMGSPAALVPQPAPAPARARAVLPAPSVRHPLTILSVGDSLGEDLGWGMAAVLASDPHVRVVQDAVGSTGLANVAYYDWASRLARDLARSRPQIVVVMLGGNDAVSFDQGGRYVGFGGTLWRTLYGGRVHTLIAEARRAHAQVVWVGMPVMATTSVLANKDMRILNGVYRQEARTGGARFVSTWRLFQGRQGGFARYLRSPGGALEEVRDPDGVHIAPPEGDELVASAVVGAIDRAYGLRLCLAPSDPWRARGAASCRTSP